MQARIDELLQERKTQSPSAVLSLEAELAHTRSALSQVTACSHDALNPLGVTHFHQRLSSLWGSGLESTIKRLCIVQTGCMAAQQASHRDKNV